MREVGSRRLEPAEKKRLLRKRPIRVEWNHAEKQQRLDETYLIVQHRRREKLRVEGIADLVMEGVGEFREAVDARRSGFQREEPLDQEVVTAVEAMREFGQVVAWVAVDVEFPETAPRIDQPDGAAATIKKDVAQTEIAVND